MTIRYHTIKKIVQNKRLTKCLQSSCSYKMVQHSCACQRVTADFISIGRLPLVNFCNEAFCVNSLLEPLR